MDSNSISIAITIGTPTNEQLVVGNFLDFLVRQINNTKSPDSPHKPKQSKVAPQSNSTKYRVNTITFLRKYVASSI